MIAVAQAASALPPGAAAGVCALDLGSGRRFERDAVALFHAASTVKLAVLIEARRRAALGLLRLDAPVALVNRFPSLAGGTFSCDPRDDTDPELYARTGAAPLGELLERMIVRSSNLATNLVLGLVPPATVTARCRALGAARTEVLRGVEDGAAFRLGLNNVTCAQDLVALLAALARGEVEGAGACVETLARQEHREGIPALLPPGVRAAHKPGAIAGHFHDAGLLLREGRPPVALAVLTRGFPSEAQAAAWVAAVASAAAGC